MRVCLVPAALAGLAALLARTSVAQSVLHEHAHPLHACKLPRGNGSYEIRNAVLHQIWNDDDPLLYSQPIFLDHDYPHTHILPEVIDVVLDLVKPTFWLEAGSMLGGSAIRTAARIKASGQPVSVVCVDPFTGDVNMLCWEHTTYEQKTWRWVRNEGGRPRIYDRFMANVVEAGHADIIIPIVATSLVGMKAIERLHGEGRLPSLPQVIYLDSAHQPDETLMELKQAWGILEPGGVLFGDDYGWVGVYRDVNRFADDVLGPDSNNAVSRANLDEAMRRLGPPAQFVGKHNNTLLFKDGQWVLFKQKAAAPAAAAGGGRR